MTVVVDASVALKWFVEEENTPIAVALLAEGERAIAPSLIIAELCNAAWRLWRRGEMARVQVSVVAERAPSLFAALVSEIDLAKRASEISLNLGHPAYDCFYLALAERDGAMLVTADRRLVERVRATAWEGRVAALGAWGATGVRTLDDVSLAPAERQAIEAAAAALRARFPITDIVLFGSKARGDSDPESDIDLLVLTERRLDWQEEQTIIHQLFDIGMRFDVVFSPLTVEADSWREGLHSVLPIHTEVEREGVRCGLGDEQPADGTPPASHQLPSSAASREALVEQVVGEWMGMADEALASARAEVNAQRWRSATNRAYYAAFYAVSAVLLKQGRHFVKHTGVQTALHRDLVHPGLLAAQHGNAYDELFKLRLIADYTVTGIDADQATCSLRQAEAIVVEMRRLLGSG